MEGRVFRWEGVRVPAFRRVLRPPVLILATMLLPLAARLIMLPWVPPPEPLIFDEFGHLLVADTLAHGRLANPPHAMWRHLESVYILHQPAYAAKYPLGQGLALAAGQLLFGRPWAGVLLAVSLMCGAVTWMLLACLPVGWAAVGGFLASTIYGLHFDWVNTYWGGAFCAFGGALVFGSLCRLRSGPSTTMGVLTGVGWMIVMLIRPFESVLLFLFIWGVVAVWGIRAARDGRLRRWLSTILLLAAGQLFAGAVTAAHNRAVTGSYTTLPYQHSQRLYGVPQVMLWQAPPVQPAINFAEGRAVYQMQMRFRNYALSEPHVHFLWILYFSLAFYCGPWLLAPLLMTMSLMKNPVVRVAAGLVTAAILASFFYPFYFPHYIAALACVIIFLIVRGSMALWEWKYAGKPLGRVAAAVLIAGAITTAVPVTHEESKIGLALGTPGQGMRSSVMREISRSGGRHLVFVRYGPKHDFNDEWVYNAADIDGSPIVICRSGAGLDDAEAARYFSGRKVWLVEVLGEVATLAPYDPLAPRQAGPFPPEDVKRFTSTRPR